MAFLYVSFDQLGPPWSVPAALPVVPQLAFALPYGLYGISYDFDVHHIEDPPPDGWGVARSHVYAQVTRFFEAQGYVRLQYSVWVKFAWPANIWNEMLGLRDIAPRGIFATCIKRLCMIHIELPMHQQWLIYDVQLGGQLSLNLYGPTPANRIPPGVVNNPVPYNWPNNPGDRLPVGVRYIPAAYQSVNWRIG